MQYPAVPATEEPGASALAIATHGSQHDPLRQAIRMLDTASASRHPSAMCEALTDLARCLALQHAYPEAEAYLGQALHWARQMPQAADLGADLLCALAEVACNEADLIEAQADDSRASRSRRVQARARAGNWAHQAAEVARHTSDPQWEVALLLRASDVLSRGGDLDDAAQMQTRAQTLIEIAEARRTESPIPGAHLMRAPSALM